MALGNNYNNDNNTKLHAREIYSFSMANRDGVDPSRLSMSFVLGLLKIQIAPKKQDSENYDYDKSIAIYLTHNKAKMLLDQIRAKMASTEEFNTMENVGVTTKSDMIISFSNGKELGISAPVLIIRKIEDGKVSMSYAYQFNAESNYIVKNFDQKTLKMEKEVVADQEVTDFCTVLEEYYKARTFATGFSVHESGVYTLRSVRNDISSIMDKLGIEKQKGNYSNKSNYNRQSFFDTQGGGDATPTNSFKKATLDDEFGANMNPPEE